ncbi:MAG TPA: hypothetical protein PLN26_11555 [Acidobacteriota bacterium]|nr:hypothetical protein [Acidobacteriota bacterium]HQG92820.1 hypothetical protein [Acidobacteriota bacterium]HQK86908.1 hypothetical protein [Acidobacteriota bacterium]
MTPDGRYVPRVAGRRIAWTTLPAFLVLMAALCAPWTLAVKPGQVEGTLTVNGESTALTHAYAQWRAGHFHLSQLDAVVLLCDRELPGAAVTDQNERLKLEKAGNLRALDLTISHEGKPTAVKARHPAFGLGSSGNSTHNRLPLDRYDETGLAGRLTRDSEWKEKGIGFTFAAEFAADYPVR